MKNIQTISDLKKTMPLDLELQKAFKEDPVKASEQLQETIPDTWIYRIVVGALGTAIILVIIAVVILSLNSKGGDQSVLTLLTAISSGAIGALAGLLAPSPKSSQ